MQNHSQVLVDSYAHELPVLHDRVVAVVVTYNRLELLKKTISGIIEAQRVPDTVVIVNNASTDETAQYLAELDLPVAVDIINLSKNTGGAGGFTVGIDRALTQHRADLVWVMDDDTEPTDNTLAESLAAWENYSPVRLQRPAVVASKVVWDDGTDHPMNTPRTMFAAGSKRHERAQAVGARPIRSGSFVSLLMDATVMRQYGLPIAEFFIWNDDFEYSTRLLRHRNGIYYPWSVAWHHTKNSGNTNSDPGPRFYNDVRNKLWVFTRRRTLSCWEKVLYGGATARLWVTTLLNTADKKTYTGYFLAGLKDAARGFRDNTSFLQGIYEPQLPLISQRLTSTDSKFSLLISVYSGDTAHHLQQALMSSIDEQTVRPDELVLVVDGEISRELAEEIERWKSRSTAGEICPMTVVTLPYNAGLAAALNEGLRYCSYDIVARADADDISLPARFEQQIPVIAAGNLAVLGSAMVEFDGKSDAPETSREALTGSEKLKKVLMTRNPIMHPTVVLRKPAVDAVGGYEHVTGAEDYWLWARLTQRGYRMDNLTVPLVKYRVGEGAYQRRGGAQALSKDIEIQHRLYTGEFISAPQLVKNMVVRVGYRAMPVELRKNLYRKLIGQNKNAVTVFRKGK